MLVQVPEVVVNFAFKVDIRLSGCHIKACTFGLDAISGLGFRQVMVPKLVKLDFHISLQNFVISCVCGRK